MAYSMAMGDVTRKYDVALSYSSAQGSYVKRVATGLKAAGLRIFYDVDQQVELLGKFLPETLTQVYNEESALVVLFVSAGYAESNWTNLERRAALDRAVRERREYLLPARFDDTRLPGLLDSLVYLDLRRLTAAECASALIAKWEAMGLSAT